MKKIGFIRVLLIVMTLLFCFTAPVYAEGQRTVVVTMKKNPKIKRRTAYAGETILLQAKRGALVFPNAEITSSKSSVASVAGNRILLKRKGKAVLTVRYGKYRAVVALKVKEPVNRKSNSPQVPAQDTGLPDDVIPISEWGEQTIKVEAQSQTQPTTLRARLVAYAKSFVGILPYKWAGNSLVTGTDCSGFIHLICAHFGISVPRSASEFADMANISYNDLQPGDIVVYKNGGHVAFYIGGDRVVHAKGSAYGTCNDSMWYGKPTGYVRLPG